MENDLLLKEEYFHLQKVVEDFDSKTITIKAWSVTGSLVVIAAGLSGKGSNELFLVGSVASLLFWLIEANWKAFQLAYYARISTIENYFSNPDKFPTRPLQLSHSWGESWHKTYKGTSIQILWWPAVMLPHIVICLGGILLYLLSYYGVINIVTAT